MEDETVRLLKQILLRVDKIEKTLKTMGRDVSDIERDMELEEDEDVPEGGIVVGVSDVEGLPLSMQKFVKDGPDE